MSAANPSIPTSLDNPELARDMRAMANRLDAQADRFDACHAALGSASKAYREMAIALRIGAGLVQPEEDPLPTAATAWFGGEVVTMRMRPDGTVGTEEIENFQRACGEAAERMRRGTRGVLTIVSAGTGQSDALGFPKRS